MQVKSWESHERVCASELIEILKDVQEKVFWGHPPALVELRKYNKRFWGMYYSLKDKIVLYLYHDPEEQKPISYERHIKTFIHEFVHHIQFLDPTHNRVKGVMHDPQFWTLYNEAIELAKECEFLEHD